MIGLADEIADKRGDDFGESYDGHTDESVNDSVAGFLDFVGVTTGGGETDAAEDNEGNCNKAGDADNPLNHAGDDGVGVVGAGTTTILDGMGRVALVDTDALGIEIGGEYGANGAHNDASGHDNGEPNKGLGEDFFAGGNFAGVAVGADVEIAAVDDEKEGEIGSGDGEVGGDVGGDDPDGGFEGVFVLEGVGVIDIDVTVPGHKTKDGVARGRTTAASAAASERGVTSAESCKAEDC